MLFLRDCYVLTKKFNTSIMVEFLKEAIIVKTPFSHKGESEKQIKTTFS